MKTYWNIFCALFYYCILQTDAWSGSNICSTTKSGTRRVRKCAYYTWQACCLWYYTTETYYYTEKYCCNGWRHNGNEVCSIPVCSPGCANGGTCIRPYTCSCRDGFQGPYCRGLQCVSYLNPCYPGYCENGNCRCTDGYGGTECRTFQSQTLESTIDKCETNFTYHHPVKNMVMYTYSADATGMNEKRVIYSNGDRPNILKMTFYTTYDTIFTSPLKFPPQPDYVQSYAVGVVEAKVEAELTGHAQPGSSRPQKHTKTSYCPNLSSRNPAVNTVVKCSLTDDNFNIRIDSGDIFNFKYKSKNGGFVVYQERTNPSNTIRREYTGRQTMKEMEFRFDFEMPEHCKQTTATTTCASLDDVPLHIEQDITKTEIVTRWSGWYDVLSNVNRYAWEIFKLRVDHNNYLTEFEDDDVVTGNVVNPVPLINMGIDAVPRQNEYTFRYTPREPGMYSVVLEVADAANNTKYARRFVLYDPNSAVSINRDADSRLHVSSATRDSGYTWQSTVNNGPANDTLVTVVWNNHFANKVHENGRFLNRILGFKAYLEDGGRRTNYKEIKAGIFEDNEGRRTTAAISNFHGIVRFELAHDRDKTGGSTITESNLQWINVTPFAETMNVARSDVEDGDTVAVFVIAFDILGNKAEDSTLVHFDSTAPTFDNASLQKNVNSTQFDFASRVHVSTVDRHSGISQINFTLAVSSSGEVLRKDSVKFPKMTADECKSIPCYRVPMGDHYMFRTQFDINNCWFNVDKSRLQDGVIDLELESFNSAMIGTRRTLQIENVRGLTGVEEYFPPMHVEVVTKTDTGFSIKWRHSPTCYERTKILLVLTHPNGDKTEYKIHKDQNTFDVAGLSAETQYTITMYNMYGDERSGPSSIEPIATASKQGLTAGAAAGLSIGVILFILLILLVVVAICWRTGRMPQKMHDKVNRPLSVIFKTDVPSIRRQNDYTDGSTKMKGSANRAYSANLDEDVYYWAGQTSAIRIPRRQISLEEEIARGKFACIYKAKYNKKGNDYETVVAKTLQEMSTEEDRVTMNAKINFLANEIGTHPNIIGYLGAVDDEMLGPMMILEYCETGTLRDYLKTKKDNVDENVVEKLFRFGFDVCKGMECLASKKIIHRRLAARNILLTFTLEIKIAGLQPMATDKDGAPDTEKKEMVPIKWLAPECISDSSKYTEKSDVWSYGIVLWEIFSLGDSPYPNIRSNQLPQRLKQGERLAKPEHCDDVFHGVMKKCWHQEPKKRPTFKKIYGEIEQLFVTGPGDDYYYEQGHLYDNKH